jgi:hypothetical protein
MVSAFTQVRGDVPEWSKGAVCKTVFHRFESDRHLQLRLFKNKKGRSLVIRPFLFLNECMRDAWDENRSRFDKNARMAFLRDRREPRAKARGRRLEPEPIRSSPLIPIYLNQKSVTDVSGIFCYLCLRVFRFEPVAGRVLRRACDGNCFPI